jgi:hypothetical protein
MISNRFVSWQAFRVALACRLSGVKYNQHISYSRAVAIVEKETHVSAVEALKAVEYAYAISA